MIQRYERGERMRDIAADHGVVATAVSHHVRKAGCAYRRVPLVPSIGVCAICSEEFTRPKCNPAKKYCSSSCRDVGAGRAITTAKIKHYPTMQGGYWFVRIPHGHVSRTTERRKSKGRAPEHVVIAEAALGRPLRKGEVVHHINCDKTDNRTTNLLVCTRAYHAWLHGEMSRRWAREHLP